MTLQDGRVVGSWSEAWRIECYERAISIDKPVEYCLTDEEVDIVFGDAEMINSDKLSKAKSGALKNRRIDLSTDDLTLNRRGLLGEFAVCKFLGVRYEKKITAFGDGGTDLKYMQRSIQVKTNQPHFVYPQLIFPTENHFKADLAVLCHNIGGPIIRICGFISKQKFLRVMKPKQYKGKWQIMCEEKHLTPIKKIKEMLSD